MTASSGQGRGGKVRRLSTTVAATQRSQALGRHADDEVRNQSRYR